MLAQATLPIGPQNALQGPAFWIGCVFALILLIVLLWVFTRGKDIPRSRFNQERFFAALLAACCGSVIAGAALFEAKYTSANTSFAFSGAAGFALFGLVLWKYGKAPKGPVVNPDISFSVPPNCKFKDAAQILINRDPRGGFLIAGKLTDEELEMVLDPKKLVVSSVVDGLTQLQYLAGGKIRRYDVEHVDKEYRLIVR